MNYIKSAEEVFDYLRQMQKVPVIRELNGISQGEMAVLAYLSSEHDGAAAGELTAAFGVGTSRTAAILNALTKKGLAKRETDPEDGRRVLVYLTDEGRQEAEEKKREAITHMAEFLELLGPEDSVTFLRIVKTAIDKAGRLF